MRYLGSTKEIQTVERIAKELTDKKIAFSTDSTENLDWGSADYGTITWSFWICEEIDLEEAQRIFTDILSTPIKIAPIQQQPPHAPIINKPKILGTKFFLTLSILIFILNGFFRLPATLERRYAESPVQAVLLFDYPKTFEEKTPQPFTPYFPGYLPLLEYTHGNIQESYQLSQIAPKFEKIKEGEIWRLFSPAFLHSDIFHLLFNMFWLLILGRSLEPAIGTKNFILFSLCAALVSNVAQYLVSGAHFLGYSGVVAAYAGFIFAKTRNNPHSILSSLYEPTRFLFFVILFFFALSFIEFGLIMTVGKTIPLTIANTAHLVGFCFGYILGHKKGHSH